MRLHLCSIHSHVAYKVQGPGILSPVAEPLAWIRLLAVGSACEMLRHLKASNQTLFESLDSIDLGLHGHDACLKRLASRHSGGLLCDVLRRAVTRTGFQLQTFSTTCFMGKGAEQVDAVSPLVLREFPMHSVWA
eukprot:jgi/Ulvmu1/2746/UM014_0203.1